MATPDQAIIFVLRFSEVISLKYALLTGITDEVNMPPKQPLIPRTQNKLLPDGSFFTPKLDDLYPFLGKKELQEERLRAKNLKINE